MNNQKVHRMEASPHHITTTAIHTTDTEIRKPTKVGPYKSTNQRLPSVRYLRHNTSEKLKYNKATMMLLQFLVTLALLQLVQLQESKLAVNCL